MIEYMKKPDVRGLISQIRSISKGELKLISFWSDEREERVIVVTEDLKSGNIIITQYNWSWDKRYKKSPRGKYDVFYLIRLPKSALKHICQHI